VEVDLSRFRVAVSRNTAEAHNAILKRRALMGLHSANSAHSLDFFVIAAQSLFNDVVAHAMRLFDRSSQSASFWYVTRCDIKTYEASANARGISTEKLVDLAARFKGIRDQTHFHIDRDAVFDPKSVWSAAGITGDELRWALESAYAILSDIQFALSGERPSLPDYDGSDAPKIIRAYKLHYPDVHIVV
jgi:hypothetical protein